MNYFALRRARKRARELHHHCVVQRHMRRDILAHEEFEQLSMVITRLEEVRQCRDSATVLSVIKAAEESASVLTVPRPLPAMRELVETLVVAFGVAMAFRAYFFQPFKIPTGSMQPTLFGHHSVAHDQPSIFDRLPLKPLKWLATGEWYHEVTAAEAGSVTVYTDRARAPGYVFVNLRGKAHRIPQDALDRGEIKIPQREPAGMADSGDRRIRTLARGYARAGDRIWSGYVTAGDHVFVNRMKWYFFPPRRGQIMVFATDGINGLAPGEHYIKRLSGLPGETIGFDPPYLTVDGLPLTEPHTIRRVALKEPAWPDGPHYPGYAYTGYAVIPEQQPGAGPLRCPLGLTGDTLTLGEDEFLALGDNTGNSYDGRFWGPVTRRRLLGPASCVYWPWSPRWGRVD